VRAVRTLAADGLSQREIARRLGINRRTASRPPLRLRRYATPPDRRLTASKPEPWCTFRRLKPADLPSIVLLATEGWLGFRWFARFETERHVKPAKWSAGT
jgi:transcriptional regulator with XRE-family HTH domain